MFLLCLLMYLSLKGLCGERPSKGLAAVLGLVAGAAALTRPDGLVFALGYPLSAVGIWLSERRQGSLKSLAGNALLYGGTFVAVVGGYLAFRVLYFGDLFPNTYYAKGGPALRDLLALAALRPRMVERLQLLMTGVAGQSGNWVLLGVLVLTVHLASTRRIGREHAVLALFLALAACDYALLPEDWMPEFRFATPFIAFFFCYTVVLVDSFLAGLRLRNLSPDLLRAVLLVLAVGASLPMYASRSVEFARRPAVPFDDVAEQVGHRFNAYADAFGVAEGSLLTPGMGGVLWVSRLKVYDLGMLCDETIARTLRKDQDAFYDYVFEQVEPTFIHVHGGWAFLAALDDDPRFRRDYLPIHEHQEVWAKETPGLAYSGDYVRREVVEGREETLRWLQAQYEP
ncbi:MAG: hypothetical protein ACUVWZ_16510 [Anaerolineae bacterium]